MLFLLQSALWLIRLAFTEVRVRKMKTPNKYLPSSFEAIVFSFAALLSAAAVDLGRTSDQIQYYYKVKL